MEIKALSGINENNKTAMISLLKSYYELEMPGMVDQETDAEKQAKEMLAQETKKVFAVRPALDPTKAIKDMAKDPRALTLANHYMKNKKIYDHKKMMQRGE